MKKGIKVLSAVMALSFGLVMANVVSAEEVSSVDLKIPAGAAEYLKVQPAAKAEKAEKPLYTPWSTTDAYQELMGKSAEAYAGLTQDSTEWARLSNIACDAAQKLEAVNNQLNAVAQLIARAKDLTSGSLFQVNDNMKLVEDKDQPLFKEDVKAFVELAKQYKEAQAAKDEEGTSTPFGTVGATDHKKAAEAIAEKINALAKKVTSEGYAAALVYMSKWTEDFANKSKIALAQEKTNLNATLTLVSNIAKENKLTLEGCALPANFNATGVAKKVEEASKKDKLPATGAFTDGLEFFKPIVPTMTAKAAPAAEEMEDGATFTFEAIKNLEALPAKKATVAAKKAAATEEQELAPKFSFNAINTLDAFAK